MTTEKTDYIRDYEIVAGTEKDIPLALALRKRLFAEMGVTADALLPNVDEVLFDTYIRAYQDGGIRHFFAYTASGEPAAVIGALIKTDFPYFLFQPGYYGWIIDAYTEPEHRGHGLASILLARTHQWLLEKGVHEAKLIAAGADARRLYERLGYRATWEMSVNLSGGKTYNEFIDERKS